MPKKALNQTQVDPSTDDLIKNHKSLSTKPNSQGFKKKRMGSNTFRSNKSETRDSFKRHSESIKFKKLSDQKTSLL